MHPDPIIDSGYPYLHIARKYNVPYEDVLAVADYVTYRRTPLSSLPLCEDAGMFEDVVRASRRFQAIRRGEIDWQTGSSIPRPLDS